jgi:hypothetical protein
MMVAVDKPIDLILTKGNEVLADGGLVLVETDQGLAEDSGKLGKTG